MNVTTAARPTEHRGTAHVERVDVNKRRDEKQPGGSLYHLKPCQPTWARDIELLLMPPLPRKVNHDHISQAWQDFDLP